MPSIDEVLLLRLLNQCQLRRHELPKLKAYTKELRRTLRALEDGSTECAIAAQAGSNGCRHSVPVSSSQNLELYKAKISTLEMALAQEEKEQERWSSPPG